MYIILCGPVAQWIRRNPLTSRPPLRKPLESKGPGFKPCQIPSMGKKISDLCGTWPGPSLVNTKTRSRQRNGDHAQGSRCRLVSQAQPDGNREREAENADQDVAARGVKWEKQTGCPRGTSEYAHGIVQVPTHEALSWRRWSTTLMWYVYKKQGHAQIDH